MVSFNSEGAFRIKNGGLRKGEIQQAVLDHLFEFVIGVRGFGVDLKVFFRRTEAVVVLRVIQFVITRDKSGGTAVFHFGGEKSFHRPDIVFRRDLGPVFERRVGVECDFPCFARVTFGNAVFAGILCRHVFGIARRHFIDKGIRRAVFAQRNVIQAHFRISLDILVGVRRAVVRIPGGGEFGNILPIGV